jgi:Na+-translocating ferredoxin:NAD+ oxidoreductase RnfC subunit
MLDTRKENLMEHECSSCNCLCTSRISLFDSLTFEEQKELIAKAQHLDYRKGDIGRWYR